MTPPMLRGKQTDDLAIWRTLSCLIQVTAGGIAILLLGLLVLRRELDQCWGTTPYGRALVQLGRGKVVFLASDEPGRRQAGIDLGSSPWETNEASDFILVKRRSFNLLGLEYVSGTWLVVPFRGVGIEAVAE